MTQPSKEFRTIDSELAQLCDFRLLFGATHKALLNIRCAHKIQLQHKPTGEIPITIAVHVISNEETIELGTFVYNSTSLPNRPSTNWLRFIASTSENSKTEQYAGNLDVIHAHRFIRNTLTALCLNGQKVIPDTVDIPAPKPPSYQ